MGLKFRSSRRSIKIAPGVRVNLGKKGLSSLSVGDRGTMLGATANLNLQTGKAKVTYSVKDIGSVQVTPNSPTISNQKLSAIAKDAAPVLPVTPVVEIVADENNLKWYQHTWLIVLLMIFLPPVSIPVMWLGQWSKPYKAMGTGCALLWCLCLLPLS